MRALSLIAFLVSLLTLVVAVVTAPDAFEFGGYLQQAGVHVSVAFSTLGLYLSGRQLVKD